MVSVASVSVSQTSSGQHKVVCHYSLFQGTQWGALFASQLWHRNNNLRARYFLGLSPTMPWVICRWVLSFRVDAPTNSLCHMLVSGMVFASCFHVPMWLPCSPIGGQPLRFATLQSFTLYPWQACVPSGDDPWPMPVMHPGAAHLTALSRGSFMLHIQLFPSHSINMVGYIALAAQQRVTQSLCLPYMARRVLFSRKCSTWWQGQLWIYGGN